MASLSLSSVMIPGRPVGVATSTLRSLPNLKTRRAGMGGVICMAYKVTLITPSGEQTLDCPPPTRTFWSQRRKRVWICRAGACSSCVGKVLSGTVDQSDNSFLDDEQMSEGFVLTCVAIPTSDLVIQTNMEADLVD